MFFIFPYKIERRFSTPVVTISLIALNVLIFACTWPILGAAVEGYAFRPDASGLFTWFSSMFLHADPMHLLGNMFFLWLFGSVVEDAVGRGRYLLLYVSGGLAAALVHSIITAILLPELFEVPLIGASGALAAITGVYMVRFYRNRVRIFYFIWVFLFIKWGKFHLTSLAAVGLWLLREVGSGVLATMAGGSSVANWAHVGGAVFGALVSMVFGLAKDADVEYLTEEAADYAQTGVHEVAAAKYAQLAQNEPDNPSWYLERARALLSSSAVADKSPAVRDVVKGVELLACNGRHPEVLLAYEQLEPVLGGLPLPARTLLTLGSASESGKRLDLAAKAYWDLVQRHPESHEAEKALFRLPHVYLAAEMPAQAAQVWETFKATYPMSEWLPYADRALTAS